MAKATIFSGACGFKTTIQAETDKSYLVNLKIDSQCPHVTKLAQTLDSLNAMNELFKKGQSNVITAGQQNIPHVTCPVPIGILKVIEVSAGMALPKDVNITLEK